MATSPRAWPTCSATAACPACDALLVSRGGRLLFEYYGEGEAENWGAPLGKVTFGPTVLHDLRSVTKSLVGMLYGIALADGKVPPPEARLYDQFPEYPDLASQPGRDRITVAHALSMTMGTEWDELTYPVRRSAQQREHDGGGARSLSLHPVSSDRRRAGREMDLLRRRHGAARSPDRQGHRGEAHGLCAARAVRSARAGACRMVDRSQRRAARRFGRAHAPTRSLARRPDGAGERRLAGQADRAGGVAQAIDDARRHHRGHARATAGTGISASFPSARRVTSNPRSAPSAGAGSACSSCRRSTSRSP